MKEILENGLTLEATFKAINLMAEDNDSFNPGFSNDLEEKYNKFGKLTDKQIGAIVNIHKQWCKDG